LAEAQVHYLRHVMRRTDGAPLLVFNGRDGEWRATLEGHGKKAAVGAAGRTERGEQSAEARCLALLRPGQAGRASIISPKKATELGAAVLQPVLTQQHQTSSA